MAIENTNVSLSEGGSKTLTTNLNYLQPSGFTVSIDRANCPNFQYFIQSVSHPGADVNATELPYRNVTSIPLAGDKITYGSLSLQVIVDEDMNSYQEMQEWLEYIVNVGHVSKRDAIVNDIRSTYGDIVVNINSSHNNKVRQIKYHDAIPTSLGGIELASTTGGTEYITFNAEFRFTQFEIL